MELASFLLLHYPSLTLAALDRKSEEFSEFNSREWGVVGCGCGGDRAGERRKGSDETDERHEVPRLHQRKEQEEIFFM